MDFLRQPLRLRADLQAHPTVEEGAVLLSPDLEIPLDDPALAALALTVDGRRRAGELVADLRDRFPSQRVLQGLVTLHQRGLVRPVGDPAPAEAGWWEAQGLRPSGARPLRVRVVPQGGAGGEALTQALEQAGLGAPPTGPEIPGEPGETLDVLLCADYLQPELEAWNRTAQAPWLPVRLAGPEAWLGPLFTPGEAGCWECLAHALRRHAPARRLVDPPPAPLPTPAPALAWAAAGCAAQLARWQAAPGGHPLAGGLLTLSLSQGRTERHALIPRPTCPACGAPASPPAPPRLDGALPLEPKDPDETWARFQHLVSPLTGILPEVREIQGGNLARIFSAPQAAGLPRSWEGWKSRRRNNAGGKGTTLAQARMSALGEGIERHSSHWQGGELVELGSWEELADRAVHPSRCMLFSERQLEEASRQTGRGGGDNLRQRVPLPFDERAPLEWARVWSLTRADWRLVAASFVYMGHPRSPDRTMCLAESNGNAAGATLEEAFLQGFCELVERDSLALWWYNRLRRPALCLDSLDHPYVEALRERARRAGRQVWVLDLTADLGIPAFAALSARLDGGSPGDDPRPAMGFGSHLDARVAAIRALTEMEQLNPSALRQSERADRQVQPAPSGWRLADHPYLLPDPDLPPRPVGSFPPPPREDPIGWCRGQVERAGMELLVADLTRPELGLPVVKVIVPGMRLHWRRLAPGRLYEVPAAMGWLPAPLAEEALNPEELRG